MALQTIQDVMRQWYLGEFGETKDSLVLNTLIAAINFSLLAWYPNHVLIVVSAVVFWILLLISFCHEGKESISLPPTEQKGLAEVADPVSRGNMDG